MWVIKSELKLYKSTRRYLMHNINVPENQVVRNYQDQCKNILFQYDSNTREFFQFLGELPDSFEIDKFIIIGDSIDIKNHLNLFLKDNNSIEIWDYLEFLSKLKMLGG